MGGIVLALLFVITALAVFIVWARKKESSQKRQFEQRLVKRCHGDTVLVERLIKHELTKRDQKISREIAAKYAY